MNNTGLKGYALVIGIDAYESGIPALQSAVRDANAMAEVLRLDHGYDVTLLCDEDASVEAIDRYLTTTFPPLLNEETAFLLYFAGHGVAAGNGTEGPQGYLIPHGAQFAEEGSWYAMDHLRKTLNGLSCRHLLVVLDCCFAGAFRWASTRECDFAPQRLYDSQFERYLNGNAWQALTSAAHDERAADLSPQRGEQSQSAAFEGHSPFAAALLRGLSGAADSSRGGHEPDGVITATELYQYVFEELKPADNSLAQTPGIWPLRENNSGEFVFGNPSSELNTLPDPPLDDGKNPWLGLVPYSASDKNIFYGRQHVVDALVQRISEENSPSLLAVVGASGTGKSSVVKAGLLPMLAEPSEEIADQIGEWQIVELARLNAEPSTQLEQSLAKLDSLPGNARQLLLIDQFEELYTQCADEQHQSRFLADLRNAMNTRDNFTVVITLRSDFEPRPANSSSLKDIWQAAKFLVPAFTRDDFLQVIEGPAKAKALFFEPHKLIDTLLDEILSMPGALPMLSFSLAEMYRCANKRRRESGATDRAITEEDYTAAGGVVGALHERANTLYREEPDEAYKRTVQRVFMRMTSSDGSGYARRRVLRSELEFGDDNEQARVEQVIRRFVDARLLVGDGDYIEPAHDTLVVAWDKLLAWLSAAGPQHLIRSVYTAAKDWQDNKQSKGLLWNNDPRLALVLTQRNELNRLEKSFVDTSEAHRKFRIKRLVFGSTLVGVAILLAAAVAFWQRDVAVQQRDNAAASALLANAQSISDPVSKGLVISEISTQKLPEPARAAAVAQRALHDMSTAKGIEFTSSAFDVTHRRGNSFISFQSLRGTYIFDSWAFSRTAFNNRTYDDQIEWATYADNESSVYARINENEAYFWQDPFQSEVALTMPGEVEDFAANKSGSTIIIATGKQAQVFQLKGTKTYSESFSLGDEQSAIVSVALNAEETFAATGSSNGQVSLWDMSSGALLQQKDIGIHIRRIDLSHDGKLLVAGGIDGNIILWPLEGDENAQVKGRCEGAVQWITFSPRAHALAAVCDEQAWVWNTNDLSSAKRYDSRGLRKVKFVLWPDSFYPGGPWPEAFSHDGLWLVGLGRNVPPVTWPVVTGSSRAAKVVPRQDNGQPVIAVTRNGTHTRLESPAANKEILIEYYSEEDTDRNTKLIVTLRDTSTLEEETLEIAWLYPYGPDEYLLQAAGEKLLLVGTNRIFWSLALFDLNEPASSRKTLGGSELHGVMLSPDGRQLLLMADNMNPNIIHKDPVLYDTENLTKLRDLPNQRFVRHGEFSPDGRLLVTTDCFGESRVWNADGSGDSLVFNQRDPEKPVAICGPPIPFGNEVKEPKARFSDDGNYLLTQQHNEQPEIHAIKFETLSEKIIGQTFACLSIEQREQILMQATEQARSDYDHCMARLGYQPTGINYDL